MPCGFSNAKQGGYEADDFLAAAVAKGERRGPVLVATGDRDAYQLASAKTTIPQPIKGGEMARVGPAEVRERYGVEPAQVPDFIALRGDASDSVPGAKGIGSKTAAALLVKYGPWRTYSPPAVSPHRPMSCGYIVPLPPWTGGAPLASCRHGPRHHPWARMGIESLGGTVGGVGRGASPKMNSKASYEVRSLARSAIASVESFHAQCQPCDAGYPPRDGIYTRHVGLQCEAFG